MRVVIFLLLLGCTAFANQLNPTQLPHPLFLKLGFSTIIEFSENPIRVVVGDNQSFQVEKMDKSLVIRTLVSYATSNLFVYFKEAQPRLFTLTASEDANPSIYNKFDLTPPKMTVAPATEDKSEKKGLASNTKTGVKLGSAVFDKSKDYLTVDFSISTDGKNLIQPKWDLIRLANGDKKISPHKIWSERQEIQKDSKVKARLIFLRPNIEKSLTGSSIVIPLKGRSDVLRLNLKKGN